MEAERIKVRRSGAPQPARPRAFFIHAEVVALQRSGLYRDRLKTLKISLHTQQKRARAAGVTWFVSSPPGSTQLVSKMGLLCKEADDAVTRMLPLPFTSFFCCQYWAVEKDRGNV